MTVLHALVIFSIEIYSLSPPRALIDFLRILTCVVHEFHSLDEWVSMLAACVRHALFFIIKPQRSSATFKVIIAESAY